MPLAVALWMSLLVLLIIFALFFQQGRASRVRRDSDPAAAPRLLPFFFHFFGNAFLKQTTTWNAADRRSLLLLRWTI
jgi:hypothetical protein